MKALKVKSVLFTLLTVMAVAVLTTSCNKEEIVIPDSVEAINKEGYEKRKQLNPCGGPNSGEVVPHITEEIRCTLNWGFIWVNGQCWACY